MHPFIEWQTEENKIKGAKVKRLVKKDSVGKDWEACEVASRILKVPTTLLPLGLCRTGSEECDQVWGGGKLREKLSQSENSVQTLHGVWPDASGSSQVTYVKWGR